MKSSALLLGMTLALLALGCTSDETAVCERWDECNLLPMGTSVEDCEQNVEDFQDPEDCRECVEDKSCSDQGECLIGPCLP